MRRWGVWIRAWRRQADMTQGTIIQVVYAVQKVSASQKTWSRWETGEAAPPPVDVAEKVAQAMTGGDRTAKLAGHLVRMEAVVRALDEADRQGFRASVSAALRGSSVGRTLRAEVEAVCRVLLAVRAASMEASESGVRRMRRRQYDLADLLTEPTQEEWRHPSITGLPPAEEWWAPGGPATWMNMGSVYAAAVAWAALLEKSVGRAEIQATIPYWHVADLADVLIARGTLLRTDPEGVYVSPQDALLMGEEEAWRASGRTGRRGKPMARVAGEDELF